MKNIDMSVVEQYNNKAIGGDIIYDFIKGNLIHLDEDIKRYSKKGYSQSEFMVKLKDLREMCVSIQDKVTFNKPLADCDIQAFDEINKYNTAKNSEMKRLAILTVVVVIVGGIISFLL